MAESLGQAAHFGKAQGTPQRDRRRVARDHKVELHGMKATRLCARLGMKTHRARDTLSTAWVKERLSDLVYRHQTPTELAQGLIKWPGVGALAVFIIGYLIALPKDNARRQVLRYGRRLRH